MRHSDPRLTANVYTDPQLLDVAGAVSHLPDLPLDAVMESVEILAEGTTGGAVGEPHGGNVLARRLIPKLIPAGGKTGHFGANAGNLGETGEGPKAVHDNVVSAPKSMDLARSGNGGQGEGMARPAGIEPTTFSFGG